MTEYGNKIIDSTGQRFTKLVAIKPVGSRHRSTEWLCICDCGNFKIVTRRLLIAGHTKSCGCLHAGKPRHGMYKTKIYRVWRSMHRRTKKRFPGSDTYIDKGISVCERWNLFENFYEDMGPTYKEGLSIDRINNDGNYEPDNCKWSTTTEQSRNKGNNVFYTIGKEKRILPDWCKDYGIHPKTVKGRLDKGMDLITALQKKPDPRYSHPKIIKTQPV
jgi:hypothetical protein